MEATKLTGLPVVPVVAVRVLRAKMENVFYTDNDIAHRLNLSSSWVRGQRHKRKNGLPHILNLEPRYIGSCPRYVVDEVEAFISAIIEDRQAGHA